MQTDPPIGRGGNRAVQPDGQRNVQLVNRPVQGYLAAVPGDRNVLERRAWYGARVEEVADVADVRVDDSLLHLKNERLRLVEGGNDVFPGPHQLPLEPTNVDAEVRSLSQDEVVSIDPCRRWIVFTASGLGGLAAAGGRGLRGRLFIFDFGVPDNAGHKHHGYNGSAEYQVRTLHTGVGLRRGRRLACRIFLRRRKDLGVTSTSSSSAINSMACSRFMGLKGTRRMASSALDARMLVSFFSRTTFTSRSLSRECSPITMPS